MGRLAKDRPPTANMVRIMNALASGPADWPELQDRLDGFHGAVLIGLLKRMVTRGLITELDDGRYIITE